MILLLLGLALWVGAHFFKRLAPGARARLQDRLGDRSKGVVALVLAVSLVLMVVGYKLSTFLPVYWPPAWGMHLNNLMMVVAVFLFGLGNSKSRLRGKMRHPMLTGVIVWGVAHLLVNGDLSSLVLFGTMIVWAVVEMILINRAEPAPARFEGGSLAGDIRLVVITLVVFVVIGLIHGLVGPSPFPG